MCDVSARLAGEKRTIVSSAHGELSGKERRSKLILIRDRSLSKVVK